MTWCSARHNEWWDIQTSWFIFSETGVLTKFKLGLYSLHPQGSETAVILFSPLSSSTTSSFLDTWHLSVASIAWSSRLFQDVLEVKQRAQLPAIKAVKLKISDSLAKAEQDRGNDADCRYCLVDTGDNLWLAFDYMGCNMTIWCTFGRGWMAYQEVNVCTYGLVDLFVYVFPGIHWPVEFECAQNVEDIFSEELNYSWYVVDIGTRYNGGWY